MAVDVSIWMVQFIKAMRDDEGNMLPHAHLIGTLRRIAKLLFHHIRPVFVFDGGVPALKRLTIERRRQRRAMHQETDYKTQAKRILVAQLRQQQLELQAAAKQEKQQKKKACKAGTRDSSGYVDGFNPGAQVGDAGVESGAVAQSESGHAAEKASNDGDEDDDGSDWEDGDVVATSSGVTSGRRGGNRLRRRAGSRSIAAPSSSVSQGIAGSFDDLMDTDNDDDDDDDDDDDNGWDFGAANGFGGGTAMGTQVSEESLAAMPPKMRKSIIEAVQREHRKASRDSYLYVKRQKTKMKRETTYRILVACFDFTRTRIPSLMFFTPFDETRKSPRQRCYFPHFDYSSCTRCLLISYCYVLTFLLNFVCACVSMYME